MAGTPNVLFILSDQHNAKVVGHKGHPDVKTPGLDRLAAEGVRFEKAITQNPMCMPSRMSLRVGTMRQEASGQGPSGRGHSAVAAYSKRTATTRRLTRSAT
ncbi:MAG: sulfatase-like hydrolase/transferase [Armatimonadota bacterium]